MRRRWAMTVLKQHPVASKHSRTAPRGTWRQTRAPSPVRWTSPVTAPIALVGESLSTMAGKWWHVGLMLDGPLRTDSKSRAFFLRCDRRQADLHQHREWKLGREVRARCRLPEGGRLRRRGDVVLHQQQVRTVLSGGSEREREQSAVAGCNSR